MCATVVVLSRVYFIRLFGRSTKLSEERFHTTEASGGLFREKDGGGLPVDSSAILRCICISLV